VYALYLPSQHNSSATEMSHINNMTSVYDYSCFVIIRNLKISPKKMNQFRNQYKEVITISMHDLYTDVLPSSFVFEDQWNAATHFYMTYEGHLLTQLPAACITYYNIAHSH
jgi:hypothetical protein